ncbi:helix-turn-helix domain-containing protein [Shewanella sp. SR44-3]|uniref:MarR family transcriptional regulator n=1 Tax=Shewanella sp. SR44-3 TaxID=2760936 RepID=UPI00217616A4|nr:helix-turn-helix domain-containing protein [Shewanella sp. SR44-3]
MLANYATDLSHQEQDSVLEALAIMRKVSLLVTNIENYFSANNLSQLRFLILVVIDREPDRTSLYAHEIAVHLDVLRPVMTRTIQKLITDGLLTPSNNEIDKRAKKNSNHRTRINLLIASAPRLFQ